MAFCNDSVNLQISSLQASFVSSRRRKMPPINAGQTYLGSRGHPSAIIGMSGTALLYHDVVLSEWPGSFRNDLISCLHLLDAPPEGDMKKTSTAIFAPRM